MLTMQISLDFIRLLTGKGLAKRCLRKVPIEPVAYLLQRPWQNSIKSGLLAKRALADDNNGQSRVLTGLAALTHRICG
ncbi:hypothetical protein [Aeromonas allosaccharophila]|uniref:hypothetical protein n=1 Tax=Aeromonas allosaccharophila TaxID=656 RepID=UPI003D20629D